MLLFSSQECQTKLWEAGHKSKCKPMNADKVSRGVEANSKKSSRISLVPTCKKIKRVCVILINLEICMHHVSATIIMSMHHSQGQLLFSYDEFLKLYNWKDFDYIPCGLMNCGNRYG
jgi:ubiquitin carboxyl-terminal hydrolase 36/42